MYPVDVSRRCKGVVIPCKCTSTYVYADLPYLIDFGCTMVQLYRDGVAITHTIQLVQELKKFPPENTFFVS
jgi:hypothetical protein